MIYDFIFCFNKIIKAYIFLFNIDSLRTSVIRLLFSFSLCLQSECTFFFSCVTLPSWSRGFDPAPRHCFVVLVPVAIKHLWHLPFPVPGHLHVAFVRTPAFLLPLRDREGSSAVPPCLAGRLAAAPGSATPDDPAQLDRPAALRTSMPAARTQSTGGLGASLLLVEVALYASHDWEDEGWQSTARISTRDCFRKNFCSARKPSRRTPAWLFKSKFSTSE